ncbi:hypothetical protein C8R45DRAFT_1077972 [Mycena sanguinolenta]|nr:hypothetical protein C8R45DRAFT_1077972 [Mycena sanguinolenta]
MVFASTVAMSSSSLELSQYDVWKSLSGIPSELYLDGGAAGSIFVFGWIPVSLATGPIPSGPRARVPNEQSREPNKAAIVRRSLNLDRRVEFYTSTQELSFLVASREIYLKPGPEPGPEASSPEPGLGLGPEDSQAQAGSGQAQARAYRPGRAPLIVLDSSGLFTLCAMEHYARPAPPAPVAEQKPPSPFKAAEKQKVGLSESAMELDPLWQPPAALSNTCFTRWDVERVENDLAQPFSVVAIERGLRGNMFLSSVVSDGAIFGILSYGVTRAAPKMRTQNLHRHVVS